MRRADQPSRSTRSTSCEDRRELGRRVITPLRPACTTRRMPHRPQCRGCRARRRTGAVPRSSPGRRTCVRAETGPAPVEMRESEAPHPPPEPFGRPASASPPPGKAAAPKPAPVPPTAKSRKPVRRQERRGAGLGRRSSAPRLLKRGRRPCDPACPSRRPRAHSERQALAGAGGGVAELALDRHRPRDRPRGLGGALGPLQARRAQCLHPQALHASGPEDF